MTQLTIGVSPNAQLVRKGLQNLSDEIPKIGRLQFYQTAMAIRRGMQVQGQTPTHPINWVSIKQRQAFFASEGFGGGIPHVRSDQYVNAWQVENIGDGYRLVNKSEGAKFIGGDAYGTNQSPIHAGRWPLFRDVSDEEIKKLPENVLREIRVVARRNNLSMT